MSVLTEKSVDCLEKDDTKEIKIDLDEEIEIEIQINRDEESYNSKYNLDEKNRIISKDCILEYELKFKSMIRSDKCDLTSEYTKIHTILIIVVLMDLHNKTSICQFEKFSLFYQAIRHIITDTCLVIDDKGQCYGHGLNNNGQLGIGNTTKYIEPQRGCIMCL